MTSKIKRHAHRIARITSVAAATVLITSVGPAMAAPVDEVGTLSNMSIEIFGSKMTFIDDGDVFQICDTKPDGKGAYGALFYDSYLLPGGFKRVMTIEDGGDAGCDKKGYNIGNGGQYVFAICPGYYPKNALHYWPCTNSASFNE
ncbi:hypothetical protein ACWGID_40470 [Kribbella sp. NPDC054772]